MIKKLIRYLWLISAPVRRPLIRKFDRHAMHLLHQLPLPSGIPDDLDLILNSVVRELARLQDQVEALQQQIDELQSIGHDAARPESRLSVVSETG
jgi:transposase